MKRLLFLMMMLMSSILALSQGTYIGDLPSATTLDGTEVLASEQGVTPVTKKISINQINTFVSSFYWPLTGSATLTGTVSIDGDVHDLILSATALNLTGTTEMNLSAPDIDITASSGELRLTGNTVAFTIGGDTGTSGEVIGSDGSGGLAWVTPSGGGATAAGSTGNVQYKSAGGGLQAEAAFSYDSATNLLTVPNLTAGSSTSLTDGAAITITGTKHTLTSDEATVTWTLSQTSDFQTTDIILNAETTTWTFPANTLCVVEGVASGDNTATLSGVSGDHYIMSTYKDGTNYRVVIKNFGQ